MPKSFKQCYKHKAMVTCTHLLGRMLIGLISERDLTFWQVDPNRNANHEAAL